jgi:hypothetical protein
MARNTKRIAGRIGCAERLGRLKRVIEANAPVSRGIYRLATTKAAAETKGGDRTVVVEFEAFRQSGSEEGGTISDVWAGANLVRSPSFVCPHIPRC